MKSILNLFNPVLLVKSINLLIKDVSNYSFYREKISSISTQGFFKDLNMRVDWISRVYYVINLEPETMLATGDLIDLEKSRVFDSVSKYTRLFEDNLLTELVEISTTRIKDSDYYGYLVTITYKKLSKRSDLFRVAWWSILIYILGSIAHSNIEQITKLVSNLLN